MGPGRARRALGPRLDLQPAVDVVREGGGQRRHHQRHREEAQQELDPRQGEHEERQVEAELRVLGPERHAVAPQQEGLPLPGRAGAGEQAEDRRGCANMAILRSGSMASRYWSRFCCCGRDRGVDRPGAVGDDQARGHQRPRSARSPTTNSTTLVVSSVTNTLPVADRVEPQHLGPQRRHDRHDEAEHHQDDEGRHQRTAAPAEGQRRGTTATGSGPCPPRRSLGPGALGTRLALAEPLRRTHATPDLPCDRPRWPPAVVGPTYRAPLWFPRAALDTSWHHLCNPGYAACGYRAGCGTMGA